MVALLISDGGLDSFVLYTDVLKLLLSLGNKTCLI